VPDATAFEAFYQEKVTRIVRACALVTLDASLAEDVAAEAFARLWSRWTQINSDDHAGGFVFKTAMRLSAREVRRSRRPPPTTHMGERVDEIDRALDRHELGRALAVLPVRQRQAVVLRDWAGLETAEAARVLGVRESTLRVHLARGRGRLRSALGAEQESPHEG
jgi:RNA polymerase sigma factor (sigma-70 family)